MCLEIERFSVRRWCVGGVDEYTVGARYLIPILIYLDGILENRIGLKWMGA